MSKQRKLRSKLSFAEDEEGADNPPPPPPADGSKPNKDSSKPKKSALLSFGDDDELMLAASKPKKDKSKVSKFHRGGISVTAPAAAAPTAQASSGEYTAEKLAALQAATQKLPSKYKPPPPAADATTTAIAAAAAAPGGIKLSGSFKPAAKPRDDRFSYTYSIHGNTSSSKDKSQEKAAAAAAAAGQLADQVAAARIGVPDPAAAAVAAAAGDADAMPLPPPPRPGSRGQPPLPAATAAAAAAAEDGSDEEGGDDDDGFLPDEETIRLAKAKRERLRQAHLAPDYVPLGGVSKLLGPGLGSSKAAGKREGSAGSDHDDDQGIANIGSGSDHDGSGSDHDQDLEDTYRMQFVGLGADRSDRGLGRSDRRSRRSDRGSARSGRAAAAAARASGQYATEVQDLDHDDDDLTVQDPAAAAAGSDDPLTRAIRRNAGGWAAAAANGSSSSSWLAGRGRGMADRIETIKAAGAGVMAALLEASSRAAGRQRHLENNLARTAANLTNALQETERVRADIAAIGEKYSAVQSLKAYLADLADCLAAKAPLVEELQDSLDQARSEAAAALRQQQHEDEQILYAQAEAAVAAALSVLGNGGAPAAAAAAAENAAADAHEAAVAAAAGDGSAETDEFGRDLGLWKRKELERGKSRREQMVASLLQELQQCKQGGQLDLEVTAAAAAAEPEAIQQYKRRRQEILDLAPTVFADADEQYSRLTAVKTKLEEFKSRYNKEYNTAYIGDSAAALFAPFVRLELLQWEPLPIAGSSTAAAAAGDDPQQQQQQQQQQGFDTQDWYQQLFEYGLAVNDAAAAAGDDADANLVPQLVESLILPIALDLVAKCWDPCNVAQSRAIVSLVSDLFVYVPADKEDMVQLLALTTGTLEAAVAAAVVPPWPTAAAAASPVAQAVLHLRFKRCAALLRSLLGFKELLSQQLMFQLALQGLMSQQLVPCLRSCLGDLGLAVARAEAAVQSLPAAYFSEGSIPREAQSLVDLMGSLGRSVEQQIQKQGSGDTGLSAGALAGLGRRVVVLLLHVGLREQAQRLGQLVGMGGY